MVGCTLSHYEVLEELSRGSIGIVYCALDLKHDREVVLPPELAADLERRRRHPHLLDLLHRTNFPE